MVGLVYIQGISSGRRAEAYAGYYVPSSCNRHILHTRYSKRTADRLYAVVQLNGTKGKLAEDRPSYVAVFKTRLLTKNFVQK